MQLLFLKFRTTGELTAELISNWNESTTQRNLEFWAIIKIRLKGTNLVEAVLREKFIFRDGLCYDRNITRFSSIFEDDEKFLRP